MARPRRSFVLLALLAAACSRDAGPDLGSFEIVEVRRDLLAGEAFWETARAREDAPPRVGVLSPAFHHSLDGAGMPSLVMAPPAEVSFRVDAPDVPAHLALRAGVDVSNLQYLIGGRTELAFDFEVAVNGKRVFDREIVLRRDRTERPGTSWVDVGSPGGLALAPGDVVTLRTFARETPAGEGGERWDPPVPLFAGFGGLRLERALERKREPASPERPSLVLIVMDTLRADRLSAYGYARPTSPHLERLAARGLLHEDALATASWTWPSTASILTGLQPEEHGVVDQGACWLASSLDTLAEALQRAGYTTAAWSGNPLVSPVRNFGQGFERFEHATEDFEKTGVFFDDVEAWLDARGAERFFLYLHLVEPHAPYEALPDERARLAADVPADYDLGRYGELSRRLLRGEGHAPDGTPRTDDVVPAEEQRWISELYDACVASGDRWLGRVLDALERNGLDGRTVVVFTNDHGEELFDRGLMNHGQSLHPELVRAPLVLAGPGIPRGARSSVPVSTRHVASTLARIAGAPWALGTPVDLARATPALEDPILFSTENGWWKGLQGASIHGLRLGPRVLHASPEGRPWGADPTATPPGDAGLYRVDEDPLERNDLAAASPDDVGVLRALSERLRSELATHRPQGGFEAGGATMELLKRIGYADDE